MIDHASGFNPAEVRALFEGPERLHWLVSHSMGAPPRAVRDVLERYVDRWSAEGPEAWTHWIEEVRQIANGVAKLIGAPPGSVGLAPNVSLLQSAIASALPLQSERNEIVYEALQFPSLAYVWTAWERAGARTVCVPTGDGRTIPTDRICAAITTKTAVVVLSHAYYQSAVLIDVPTIVARARDVGALVVLDTYQTTGIVPYTVDDLDVDIVVGGSHKWLCGGAGCAWIYVRQALKERFEPLLTGWFAHREPFRFAPPPIVYADDAFRFASGTPTILGYLTARPGHDAVARVGIAAIREHNARLLQKLIAAADDAGWPISTPREPLERTGWVGIDLPDAGRLADELFARNILVDYRPGCGIRVSAHAYTMDHDIDAFIAAVHELRGMSVSIARS